MEQLITYFLIVYFVAFFGISVVWRNYVVSRKTGVNAFKLNQETGVESITGVYFKYLPLVSILVFLLYALLPGIYTKIGPIELLNYGSPTI